MRVSIPIVLVLCGVLLTRPLCGGEPDFSKLAPMAPFPSAVESARANTIALAGFDAFNGTDRLAPGDSITALITLFEKGGKRSQWLLSIEAVDKTAEERARTNKPPLILHVGAGDRMEFNRAETPVNLRLLGPFVETPGNTRPPKARDERARVRVNEGFLALGLDQAAAATHRMVQSKAKGAFWARARPFTEAEVEEGRKAVTNLQLTLKEQRALVGANMALDSFTRLVQQTPGLHALLFKVVKPPSIWSVVWNLGVKITLDLERKFVGPTDPTKWNLTPDTPCYTYPLTLRVNGKPALTTTLVAIPPRPPFLGCAGIVGMLAENPNEKETYLTLRIISARHGSASP